MDNMFQGPGDENLRRLMGQHIKDQDPKSIDPKNILVTGKSSGGLSAAAKQTLEDRKKCEPLEEYPIETCEYPTLEMTKPEGGANADAAVLSAAKWPESDTLFHQEVQVSVTVALPKGKEHITRVTAELFARQSSGRVSISKGEGHAQADGTAVIALPVYKPRGHEEGVVEMFIEFTHKLAKMLSTVQVLRPVSETALKSTDHILIQGTTFDKDTSFIGPKGTQGLKAVETRFNEWKKKYSRHAQIAIFGHADMEEKDSKGLSERRAHSAFAFITNDAEAWDNLYRTEKWGLRALQTLLKDLGHYDGRVDGEDGPSTQIAFKAFQKEAGLPETGMEDSTTRQALYAVYMKGKHDIKIEASRFVQVAGHEWMGCAARNRVKVSEEIAKENRRVAFILINTSKYFPVSFPCQNGSEIACQGQCEKAGKRSAAGIKCLFYDELVREEKQEVEREDRFTAEQDAKDSAQGFISLKDGLKIAATAKDWVGTPYVTGGENKDGADCSGSVFGIYTEAGFPFSRVSSFLFPEQPEFKKVPGNEPQIGDVGFWPGHLMIYDIGAGTTRKGESANGWSATRPKGLAFGVARHQWFDDHYETGVIWYRYVKQRND